MATQKTSWDIFIFFLAGIVIGALVFYILSPEGGTTSATSILRFGSTYECLTKPVQEDDYWYAIVRSRGKIHGLHFGADIPQKGVVANKDGKKIFVPMLEPMESPASEDK